MTEPSEAPADVERAADLVVADLLEQLRNMASDAPGLANERRYVALTLGEWNRVRDRLASGSVVRAGFAASAAERERLREIERTARDFDARFTKLEDQIDGAFVFMAVHGCEYKGPTYEHELKALRAALSSGQGGGPGR